MNGEVQQRIYLRTIVYRQHQLQIVVVVHCTAIHLNGLDDRLSCRDKERITRRQVLPVHVHPSTIGVASGETQMHKLAFGAFSRLHLSVVGQSDVEDSGLVGRYIGLLVGVQRHLGLGGIERCVAQHRRATVVEDAALFSLVRTITAAAFGKENITAVYLIAAGHLCSSSYCGRRVHIHAVQRSFIHRHRYIAAGVRRKGKARFLAYVTVNRMRFVVLVFEDGGEDNLPFRAIRLAVDGVRFHIFTDPFVVAVLRPLTELFVKHFSDALAYGLIAQVPEEC